MFALKLTEGVFTKRRNATNILQVIKKFTIATSHDTLDLQKFYFPASHLPSFSVIRHKNNAL